MAKYTVTDIEYDTDGVNVELPKELVINVPDDEEDVEDFIGDEISNITGYCHLGFTFDKK